MGQEPLFKSVTVKTFLLIGSIFFFMGTFLSFSNEWNNHVNGIEGKGD